MTNKAANYGFTLIELVSIIALIGVMAVVALTFVPSVANSHLSAAAKQVLSDIEYARQNATMTKTTSGLSFISGGSYTVYQGSSATPLADPLSKQSMVVTLSSKYPGISISSNYTVEFNSFGTPTTGGGGSVTITSGSASRIISVTANTGKVTIQ